MPEIEDAMRTVLAEFFGVQPHELNPTPPVLRRLQYLHLARSRAFKCANPIGSGKGSFKTLEQANRTLEKARKLKVITEDEYRELKQIMKRNPK